MPTYNTLFTDTMQRANENPLSDGGNWSLFNITNASLEIVSNQAVSANASFPGFSQYIGSAVVTADQWISARLASYTSGGLIDLYVRASSTSNYYRAIYGTNFVFLYAGSTFIGSASLTLAVGDVLMLAAQGSTISAFQNSNLILAVTNTAVNNTSKPALGVAFAATEFDTGVINVNLGSITSAPPPSNYYSVPDSRTHPNASRNVNGTLIYDVQTSSNPAIPPTDDRADGAPIASGEYPSNSRSPGKYGPGNN